MQCDFVYHDNFSETIPVPSPTSLLDGDLSFENGQQHTTIPVPSPRRNPQLTIKASQDMQYDSFCQDTIKASQAMQRGSSYQDNFSAMRAMTPVPSPSHTAPIKPRGSVDMAAFPPPDFLNMSELKMDVTAGNGGYNSMNCSPMTKASSTMSSFQSSPEMGRMSLFGNMDIDTDTMAARLLSLAEPSSFPDPSNNFNHSNHSHHSSYSSPGEGHAQSRCQSISEVEDLEEFVENTGISQDDVASFISGPDADNRWKCLYADCGKTFGRKENIKSHVQTHLGDRQYRCKQCNKKFVRQHDLKRHANIHTNTKTYTCPCSKEFARHDALTRHRQRGMCIGAFDGTPKKVVKRGRPKKSRPETEERQEKAAATRQRVYEKIAPGSNCASSASSVSSHSSPPPVFESPSMQALPMSRQESAASSQSFYSTPPELELSSSSPVQQTLEFSAAAFLGEPSPNDFFGKEFELSDVMATTPLPTSALFKDFSDTNFAALTDDFELFGSDEPVEGWLNDL